MTQFTKQELSLDLKESKDNLISWFGNSEVVDEQGNPLVVYHGTNKQFDSFKKETIGTTTDAGLIGKGFYFHIDPDTAKVYGKNVIPCYLRINKLYDFNNGKTINDNIRDMGIDPEVDNYYDSEDVKAERIANNITNWFKQNGYDGARVWGQYMVLEPDQIKATTAVEFKNNDKIYEDKMNILEDVISLQQARDQKVLDNVKDFANALLQIGQEMQPSNPYEYVAGILDDMHGWTKKDWERIFKKELTFKDIRDAKIVFGGLAEKVRKLSNQYATRNESMSEQINERLITKIIKPQYDEMEDETGVNDFQSLIHKLKTANETLNKPLNESYDIKELFCQAIDALYGNDIITFEELLEQFKAQGIEQDFINFATSQYGLTPDNLSLQVSENINEGEVINLFDYKYKQEDLMALLIDKYLKNNDYYTLYKVAKMFKGMPKHYIEKNLNVELTDEQFKELNQDLVNFVEVGNKALTECQGGVSNGGGFSAQLGTAPTTAGAMVLNQPVVGKSVVKRKKKKEDK